MGAIMDGRQTQQKASKSMGRQMPHAARHSRPTASLAEKPLVWVRAVRPFSFTCAATPVIVATAAALPVGRWRWDALGAALIAVVCLEIVGNLLNDYFDYTSGVDTRSQGDEGRPGRLLVTGEITPRQVLRVAVAGLVVALATAAYLSWRVNALVLAFYAVGIAAACSYTGPPLKLKSRALGEPTILFIYGPAIMSAAAYVQVERIPMPVALLSIPVGLSTTFVLAANNLRDMEEDAAGGGRTLAHVLGGRRMAGLFCALAPVPALGVAAVGLAFGAPLLALSLLSLATMIGPVRAVATGVRVPDIDARTARYNLVLSAIAAGVLIAGGGL